MLKKCYFLAFIDAGVRIVRILEDRIPILWSPLKTTFICRKKYEKKLLVEKQKPNSWTHNFVGAFWAYSWKFSDLRFPYTMFTLQFSFKPLLLKGRWHRLNMELDLQIFLGSMCPAVLIGWDPATSPPPRIWVHKRRRYWSMVSQDRRHLFVTPGRESKNR